MLHWKRNGEESERDSKKHGWLTSALIQRTTDDVSLSIRLIWLFVWMVFLCISFTIGRSRQSQRNGNDTMYIASLTTCLLKKNRHQQQNKTTKSKTKNKAISFVVLNISNWIYIHCRCICCNHSFNFLTFCSCVVFFFGLCVRFLFWIFFHLFCAVLRCVSSTAFVNRWRWFVYNFK